MFIATRRNSNGPGGECRLLEVIFCEYVIRGSTPPHPDLLAFTNIKQAYKITVDKATSPILEGPGCNRWFEDPICECAMRGSLEPHPTRLRSPSITKGSGCPVIVPNSGTLGTATRSCRFEVPIWRNTQCESLRRRMLFSSHRHARKNYHSPRSACQNRESRTSKLRNVHFGESKSANDDAPSCSRPT